MWPFRSSSPTVSVLRLTGVISPTPRPMRGQLSMADLAGSIDRAFSVRGVRGVALAVNSPGGSPVQSALIAARIRAMAREKDIPVFAFVEDVAASGGYWLACAADEIFADTSSLVGSIGVISAGFGFTEAIQKLGVERRVYARGDHKALLDPFQPEKPDDVERLRAIQEEIHQAFIDHVRDRRGKRLRADDDTLFNGDVWTGRRALELGLVDGLGDMRSLLRERFGDKVKLRVVSAPKSWLRRRLRLSGLSSADLATDLAAGLLDAVDMRAQWNRYGL